MRGRSWTRRVGTLLIVALLVVSLFAPIGAASNDVTFDGTVSLSGGPADDGTEYTYDLADASNVEDFEIDLEGQENTAGESSQFTTDGSGSESVDVGGTTTENAEVTLTGREDTEDRMISRSLGGSSSDSINVDGNVNPEGVNGASPEMSVEFFDTVSDTERRGEYQSFSFHEPYYFSDVSGEINSIDWSPTIYPISGEEDDWHLGMRVYVAEGDVGSEFDHEGTVVTEQDGSDRPSEDMRYFDDSDGEEFSDTVTEVVDNMDVSNGVTIGITRDTSSDVSSIYVEDVTVNYGPDDSVSATSSEGSASIPNGGSAEIDLGYGSETIDFGREIDSYSIDLRERWQTKDPSVGVTSDGGTQTVSHSGMLEDGETITESINLEPGEQSVNVDTGGSVTTALDWTEVTETVDPTFTINGESASYDGTLADGETASIPIDGSWLEDGTNRVTVSTNSPTFGPAGKVGFTYAHSSPTDQSVDYRAETWSESYNTSRTWDDATDDASVTIPFSSDRVVGIRDIETRTDGGTWSALSRDDYSLDGTTLMAQLGEVSAGQTVAVRATGSKVSVENGEIDVLEPTVEGDTLDTKVEIVDHSDEFAVDVSGTSEGNWLHRTVNESWSASSTSSVFHATGEQEIRAPGASSGSTTRVQAVPLEVSPNAGDVAISSVEPNGDEIRFNSEPDGATEVDYTWHETRSGERYMLYSDTHGVVRDSATASSPVTLTGSSYDETLQIMTSGDDDGGGEVVGTSGAGGVGGAVSQATGVSSPIILLVVGVGLLVGMAVVASRTRVPMWIVGVGGSLLGLISLEAISPGTISSGVSSTVVMIGSAIGDVWSEVGAPVLLIAVMVGAWLVVRWWQTREERATEPDTAVNFNLRDD